jgi:hypothetical protein
MVSRCSNFPKIYMSPENSRRHEGDLRQYPCCGPTSKDATVHKSKVTVIWCTGYGHSVWRTKLWLRLVLYSAHVLIISTFDLFARNWFKENLSLTRTCKTQVKIKIQTELTSRNLPSVVTL